MSRKPASGRSDDRSRRDVVKAGGALAIGSLLLRSVGSFARAIAGGPLRPTVSLIAGEPSSHSILLQARVSDRVFAPTDVETPGLPGKVRFVLSSRRDFSDPIWTSWTGAEAENDFIARQAMDDLRPDTQYFYKAELQTAHGDMKRIRNVGRFRTLPGADSETSFSFAVFSCMRFETFYGIGKSTEIQQFGPVSWLMPAEGLERKRGYPAMAALRDAPVSFLIATGDTIYYDSPNGSPEMWARTIPQMRMKWHKQFAMPTVCEALASHPTFWMKDDHDFRYDDADNSSGKVPLAADGRAVFHEQVPLHPVSSTSVNYRTVRPSRFLQVWIIEGRDYRSPNRIPDGPDKTMWGTEQRAWLEQTLLESDATFKIVVSPTPIIGPDDARKSDGQASSTGFRYEGDGFLDFLVANDLVASTLIVNGDRHWQYHSVHPTGVEEFGCGTVHRQNSRYGVAPGDAASTDPNALIRQPYLMPQPRGGYLTVTVEPGVENKEVDLIVSLFGENGDLHYAARRHGQHPNALGADTVHGQRRA